MTSCDAQPSTGNARSKKPLAPRLDGSELIYLALDCATSTGWAFNTPDGGSRSGTISFKPAVGESAGMRFVRFNAWLRALIASVRPDVVVYEQAHHRGKAATHVGVGLATRVQEQAAAAGIEYGSVHTATLKKHATGNGRAGKADMVRAAEARWPGVEVETDDQADALCLLSYALDVLR